MGNDDFYDNDLVDDCDDDSDENVDNEILIRDREQPSLRQSKKSSLTPVTLSHYHRHYHCVTSQNHIVTLYPRQCHSVTLSHYHHCRYCRHSHSVTLSHFHRHYHRHIVRLPPEKSKPLGFWYLNISPKSMNICGNLWLWHIVNFLQR